MRTCLVVLGMHRSGTSALAGLLSLLGADAGADLMPATEFNPKGYCELQPIFDLNELLLARLDRRWHDIAPLPPGWTSLPAVTELMPLAQEIIAREFSDSSLCVVKDPRFCLLLPFWADCLAAKGFETRHVVIVRSPDESIASLEARDLLSADKCAWLWLRYVLDAEQSTRGKHRLFLSFESLFTDWRGAVVSVNKGLDLGLLVTPDTIEAVGAFLDPQLRHFHTSRSGQSGPAPHDSELRTFCEAVYVVMRGATGRDISKRALAALDDIRAQFETWSAEHIVADLLHEHARTRRVVFGLNDSVAMLQATTVAADEQIERQSAQLDELERARLQDAGTLRHAEARNDALIADVSALIGTHAAAMERIESRKAELEATLVESNEHRASLEERLGAAAERETGLERQLADSSEQRRELEAQLDEARESRIKLQAQLGEARERGIDLDGQLAASNKQGQGLELQLRESSEQRAALDASLGRAQERENGLGSQLAAAVERSDELGSRLSAVSEQMKRIEGSLREAVAFHRKVVARARPQVIGAAILPRDEGVLEGIRFACELPENNEPLTGDIDIIGWCFGTVLQVVGVELLWNGTPYTAVYGGLRSDVSQAYPQHAGAMMSNFRCTVNAPPGPAFIGLVALCTGGQRVQLGEGILGVRPNPLKYSLDTPPLGTLRPGTTRFLGWCFSRDEPIAGLALSIGNNRFPCLYRLQRDDVALSFPAIVHAGQSGFECDAALARGCFDIRIEATLASGEQLVELLARDVRVRPVGGFKRALQRAAEQIDRVRHTSRRAAIWVRRQGRLPRWHELPLLFRKAGAQLRTPANDSELQPPARWSIPPMTDPYDVWLQHNALTPLLVSGLRDRLTAAAANMPRLSVVMPVFNPDLELLERAIGSVQGQILTEWELCIADDSSSDVNVRRFLQAIVSQDARIRVTFREVNGNISAATNSAASLANGTFLVFLDQDDELSPDALGEIALHLALHRDTDLLYSDDDKIDRAGRRYAPQFKPDWSPELLLSYMYVGHALVVRRRLFEQLGGFRLGFEGSQDHDFALRAGESARRVGHIPLVLYHWRATRGSAAANADAKPAGFLAGERAVQEALVRRNSKGRAIRPSWARRDRLSLYAHEFADDGPLVTIIIPTRNNHASLRRCLDSLAATTYRNFEITIADNGSDDAGTLAYLGTLPHRVLESSLPNGRANFASLCNRAAGFAGGDFLLILGDATQVLEPRWLSIMVGCAQFDGVGAVGAQLAYPDGSTQHAGIVHGLYDGLAGPAFESMPGTDHGYLYYAKVMRNCSAVTAACLLTPRQLFLAVGGFDEQSFPTAYNDVDYCYRLVDAGHRCVYAPGAKLLHHQGYSRGFTSTPQEVSAFRAKYRERNDPYYSPHLSLDDERFSISARRLPRHVPPSRPARALMCAFTLNLEGAPYSQFELTLALKQAGVIDPVVYSPLEGPLRGEYERNGIPVHVFAHPLRGAHSLTQCEEAVAVFSHWLQTQGAEVVYANTMESFYAVAAARHANIPSIWNIRESEPWQTYYRHFSPEIAGRALDCFVYPYLVIFVAHATRERYAALATRHQFTVIHNGLNLERLAAAAQRWPRRQARAELGLADDEILLLSLGTVCERKGQMDLVEALALLDAGQIAKCRCFIVGDRPGTYSERLNRRARDLARERGLRITIVPETHDTALYYRAADIFVGTSRVESYPRVILEAMAHSLPIVTTPVFGVREQVIPEINGLFYEPADVAGLRGALNRLLTDDALRARFAENATAVLATLTSFEEMVARYGRVFIEAAECQQMAAATKTVGTAAPEPQTSDRAISGIAARRSATAPDPKSAQNTGE